jgi:hypothetical protein
MHLNHVILPISLFFILSSIASGLRYACPTEPEIIKNLSPCTCSSTWENTNMKIQVKCNSIKIPSTLWLSLTQLSGYKIDELVISGADLGSSHLPEDPFLDIHGNASVGIETLIITDSTIGDIAEAVHKVPVNNEKHTFFSGLGSSLKVLKIEKTKGVGNWAWNRLANSLSTGVSNSSNSSSCTRSLELHKMSARTGKDTRSRQDP